MGFRGGSARPAGAHYVRTGFLNADDRRRGIVGDSRVVGLRVALAPGLLNEGMTRLAGIIANAGEAPFMSVLYLQPDVLPSDCAGSIRRENPIVP